jgi:uncharacterized RmlC-like cupin family protein
MATSDGFQPDFSPDVEAPNQDMTRNRVHHIRASEISSDTAQSEGLQRFAALSGRSVGAEKLWMGETHVSPETVSANHHHGESETAIYVRSGNPEFVFHDGVQEVRISTQPGDYVFVPPYLPHREENPDANTPACAQHPRGHRGQPAGTLPALSSTARSSVS